MTKIAKIRRALGMTQVQVAEMIGREQQAVAWLERCGIKRASTARVYAAALGVAAFELID
ncbi:MAG: helix-turn-helix transcriptional regulator [Victivallaceae bacterium]|nr:helix-turn-helix transcriptional regulator [Victivallaceae bacterium]